MTRPVRDGRKRNTPFKAQRKGGKSEEVTGEITFVQAGGDNPIRTELYTSIADGKG